MARSLSNSEVLVFSTTRIECSLNQGGESVGTGFFFNFSLKPKEQMIPALVTNKHVVHDANTATLYFHAFGEDGLPVSTEESKVTIGDFADDISNHPSPDVDLCAIPMGGLWNRVFGENKKPFMKVLNINSFPSEEELNNLTPMEEVIMIGYPNGIWDPVNNQPILRHGITATDPKRGYRGKDEFLIDMACFPGSSGSPVFLFNGMNQSRSNLPYTPSPRIDPPAKLLGILYAGTRHTAEGEIEIIEVPVTSKAITKSLVPNNLGVVIKFKMLEELINSVNTQVTDK